MKKTYLTNCVNSTYDAINDMISRSRGITYKTFIKYVDWKELSKRLGYAIHPKQGLTLKKDYVPSYYKSVYLGKPCYYIRWSAIEYIFV